MSGTCGKCGAPYSHPSGAWLGIYPPAPIPNCNCWNTGVETTTFPVLPVDKKADKLADDYLDKQYGELQSFGLPWKLRSEAPPPTDKWIWVAINSITAQLCKYTKGDWWECGECEDHRIAKDFHWLPEEAIQLPSEDI